MNNIFDNIETEKRVELNDRLWQRVEDKLDVNKYRSKSNHYKWIAACAVLVLAAVFLHQDSDTQSRPNYRVTDFSIDAQNKTGQSTDTETVLKTWYDNLLDCTIKRDKYSC